MKEREKSILEAARQVFGDHGFYQTKIQDIADTAGIGKGTVYEYFSSKEELFCRMVEESFFLYARRVRESLCKGGCKERLLSYIGLNRHIVTHSGPLMDLFLSNGSIGEDKQLRQRIMDLFLDTKQEIIASISNTLILGQEEGVIAEDIDTGLAAEMFLHMSMACCQHMARTGDKNQESDLLDIFMRGVGK